jgi:ectoine hydroxylase-related dioxygenase (phytanoyl-CoA dioxygenase family)
VRRLRRALGDPRRDRIATCPGGLGVILEYAAGWLRQQENNLLAIPRDIVRELPEWLQELLGYNIYPPFVGWADGMHPRQVLAAGRPE